MKQTKPYLDGRSVHNTPVGVLSRIAGELAYTMKRACLRHNEEILAELQIAENAIERALVLAEQGEK